MKRLLLFFFFSAPCLLCGAQDNVKVNVVYEFSYVRDLENKAVPYEGSMVLSLGKKSSRYGTAERFENNNRKAIEARRQEQERLSNMPSGSTITAVGGPVLTVGTSGAVVEEEIIKDLAKGKMAIETHLAIRTYRVELPLPVIAWTVTEETKKIGDYDCQKATGSFGGRVYEAWFTTQLPYQNGPWKLGGLPGLILEASDSDKEVVFRFKELIKNNDPEEIIGSFLHSEYSIKTNIKDLEKAKQAFITDPEGVMAAQAPGARVMVKNLDEPSNKTVVKTKNYNPMER